MAVIINNPIIDTHIHSGHWWVRKENAGLNTPSQTSGNLILRNFLPQDTLELTQKSSKQNQDTVSRLYISNLDCIAREQPNSGKFLKNEYDGNLEIYNQYKNNPAAKLYAVCQPREGSVENIKRVFRDTNNGFVGLKFHPVALNLPVDEKYYGEYMQFAQKHKLPCLFHSQVAIDWTNGTGKVLENIEEWNPSDPRLIYNLAKKYKDVPIILGHTGAGGEPAHKIAMQVLFDSIDRKDAKLYAEISWMDFTPDGKPADNPKNLIELIKGLKKRNALDRIIFGSDFPLGIFGETAKDKNTALLSYKEAIEKLKKAINKNFLQDGEDIITNLFRTNPQDLFFDTTKQNKLVKKSKLTYIMIGISALVATGIIWFKKPLMEHKIKK